MSDCCNEFEFTNPQGTFYMDGGIRGKDGVTFYPHVSAAGVLSWTNDGGKQNPDPVNIKGADGMSAYAAAQQAGFTGTEQEFNAYLSGIGDLTEDVADLKSAFNADLVSTDWAPNITKGSYIKVANGAAASSNKYARTGALWDGFGARKAIAVNDPTYEFCIALYDETGNLSGTGYLESLGYSTGMQYIPKTAAKIGISFRRVDQAALADEDITAISTALSALAATDTTLSVAGAPADAKTTGDRLSALNTESTPFNWTKIATRSNPLGWRTGRYRASNGTYNPVSNPTSICTGFASYIAPNNVRGIKITAPNGYKISCCEFNANGRFVQTIGSTSSTTELEIQTTANYEYKFTVGEFTAGTAANYLTSEFINSITLIEYYYIESVKDTKHLNILLFGNSYGADSFAYVPFMLKKYGITTNIHFYYRGSGSVDRLVAEWEDDTATGLDDFGRSHVRRYTHIDTRYETKWETVSADFHPSPKTVLEYANTDINIGQWDIIVLFTGSRSQSFTKAPGNGDPRKGAEPYIRQAINLINTSYTKPYKLAWFEDYTSFDGYSGNVEHGYPPITPQEMDNRVGVLKSAETIMGAEPFDMVIPAGSAVFNARTNASLASTNLSATGNLWCSDKIHLQAGIPNYIVNCAVVQSIFNKFFPEYSVLNDDTRITDTLISTDYACPFIKTWCGSVLDSTELLYDLGQKAAVMACKYPYDITPIYLPTDTTELELFDTHNDRYWADALITRPNE